MWLSQIPNKLLTRENDIIINSTGEGTLGRASVITSKEHVGLACDSHILLLRVNPEKVDPLLFVYLFNSSLGQKQVDLYKSAQATKQTELGIENTKKIRFPMPDISSQREISISIRRETAQANELLEQAKKLRLQSKLEFEKTVFGG